MTLLLDHCRDVIGLPMRGLRGGYHIGWTTDKDNASAAREAGANLSSYTSDDPMYSGWEVSFLNGREVSALQLPGEP